MGNGNHKAPQLPDYQQRMAEVAERTRQRMAKLTRLYVYARQRSDPATGENQALYELIQTIQHALDQEDPGQQGGGSGHE